MECFVFAFMQTLTNNQIETLRMDQISYEKIPQHNAMKIYPFSNIQMELRITRLYYYYYELNMYENGETRVDPGQTILFTKKKKYNFHSEQRTLFLCRNVECLQMK